MAQAQQVLQLYTWQDYIDPALIKQFEKQTGATVKQSYFANNEELFKALSRGGTSRYDVVVPSDFIVPQMIKANLLMPLDKAKVPNLKNLDAKFANPPFDPGNRYTAGYLWGTVGILYNNKTFPTPPQSWSVIFNPKQQKGPFFLMDSQREMLGVGLRFLGRSVNGSTDSDLWDTIDALVTARKSPNFKGFRDGVSAGRDLSKGGAVAAVVYSQDALLQMENNPNLSFTIPKEGSTLYLDNLAIPAKAPNPQLAHQFINFILEGKAGAQLAEYLSAATPNATAKALLRPAMLNNPAIYPSAAQMKSLEFINTDSVAATALAEAWKQVKSGF